MLSGSNAEYSGAISPTGLASRKWAHDQLLKAVDYEPAIVAYRNGSAVRLRDGGEKPSSSVEDVWKQVISTNGKSVLYLLVVFRQPGCIDTVDGIRAALPQLKTAIPQSIKAHRLRWIRR